MHKAESSDDSDFLCLVQSKELDMIALKLATLQGRYHCPHPESVTYPRSTGQ